MSRHAEHSAVWRMIFVDREVAYAGFYPEGLRGYEGPLHVFSLGAKRGLFYPFQQYKVWESADVRQPTDERLGAGS